MFGMNTFTCSQLDSLLLKILVLINMEFIQLVIIALVIIVAFYFLIGAQVTEIWRERPHTIYLFSISQI